MRNYSADAIRDVVSRLEAQPCRAGPRFVVLSFTVPASSLKTLDPHLGHSPTPHRSVHRHRRYGWFEAAASSTPPVTKYDDLVQDYASALVI